MAPLKSIEDALVAQDRLLETKGQLNQARTDQDTAKQACLATACPLSIRTPGQNSEDGFA